MSVGEDGTHDVDRVGEGLPIGGVEPLQVGVDDGPAVGPHPSKDLAALRGDADQHGAGVGRVLDARYQGTLLEAADLRGHGGLRAVVEGGEVGDAGRALVLDRREKPGLGEGEFHLHALGGEPIQSRDDG